MLLGGKQTKITKALSSFIVLKNLNKKTKS